MQLFLVIAALISLINAESHSTCSTSVLLSKNDTCENVAERFRIPVKFLLEQNPNANCQKLIVGTTLCINPNDVPKDSNCSTKATIRAGDTCYNLSLTYNTHGLVEGLKKINPDINCDNLIIGSVVCVKVGPEDKCGRFTDAQLGDSCFQIAKDFNLGGLAGLQKLNPFLDCESLQAGQMVCIRA